MPRKNGFPLSCTATCILERWITEQAITVLASHDTLSSLPLQNGRPPAIRFDDQRFNPASSGYSARGRAGAAKDTPPRFPQLPLLFFRYSYLYCLFFYFTRYPEKVCDFLPKDGSARQPASGAKA
jgi:hypothetical protein